MNKGNRWEQAQNYEKNWWNKRAPKISFDFYKTFADDLVKFIEEDFTISADTKILEIGSGAGGIITFLTESKHRYAIDPLEKFYSSQTQFVEQRDKEIIYSEGKGESLAFENDFFDLVIMDNVLDHCENPALVFSEATRVLKKGGHIYFKQNKYNVWGKTIRTIMEYFLIDKGHPFTFTRPMLLKLVKDNNLVVMNKTRTGYFKTWKKEISSFVLKDLIKALLFVTRDKVTCLLKK